MPKHSAELALDAQPRTITGRAVSRLRDDGLIPATLYGKGHDPISLQLSIRDFEKVYRSAGASSLVSIRVGDSSYPTIIHEVARDPKSGSIIHADFFRVRMDEEITSHVPVVFVGSSPAVADAGGILVRLVNELEVSALPGNLPHEISVDISKLIAIGDRITIGDIQITGVKFSADNDDALVTVQEPKSEEELAEELAAPTTDVSAVEEIKKEKLETEEVVTEEVPTPTAKIE